MKRLCIDARNLRCPLPLLKLKQGLAQLQVGEEVEIKASDAGAWRDIPAFVALTEHELIAQSQAAAEYIFIIKKGE